MQLVESMVVNLQDRLPSPEHMEEESPEKPIPPWVELEYTVRLKFLARVLSNHFRFLQHMRTLAGPQSHIHFTRLSTSSINALLAVFRNSTADTLAGVSCHDIGVLDLANQSQFSLGGTPSITQICLLDPKADLPLSPEDGDGRFMWFLFGVSALTPFVKS